MTQTEETSGPQLGAGEQAFLLTERVARLATMSVDSRPHLVPVCYHAVVTDARLAVLDIALDEKPKRVPPEQLRRVRNVLANPAVSLLIDRYDDADWHRVAWLRVDGQARLLQPDDAAHGEALAGLRAKYPQYRAMALEDRPVIRIAPARVTSWGELPDEAGPTPLPGGLPFAELARARRSVRHFRPDPVPHTVVTELIEVAGWAPSPHGRQPWRFAVITSQATKDALADAMGETWTAQLALDGQDAATVAARLDGSRRRLLTTPVLIVPCLYTADLDYYPDPARQAAEEIMAIQSLGAAVQNLLLAATDRGLDTGWMCAPLFCPDVVRDVLGLATGLVPHAIITLGWAARDPRRRGRLPVETLIVYEDEAESRE